MFSNHASGNSRVPTERLKQVEEKKGVTSSLIHAHSSFTFMCFFYTQFWVQILFENDTLAILLVQDNLASGLAHLHI